MQCADLQACLGFLQAIHYSAKIANVNKEICQKFSRVVGRIRPLLEEVDMTDSGEQHKASLRMIESSLENISVAIGRFSTMGYLQAVLEAQSMCDNFSKSRKAMIEALQNLAESRLPCSTQDWCDDVKRVCELLNGLRFEDCDHLKVAKRVHTMARQIMDGEIELKEGQLIIRSQLLANRNLGPKAMQEEIQGLERELSRARVEKEQHEVEELHTIIRTLKQSSHHQTEQASTPQPPVEYLCPISHRIMKDPVVLVATGQTYDRKYIEEWFGRGNRTCPVTKQEVIELNLTPNYALKSLASSWCDVNSAGDEEDDNVMFQRSPEPEVSDMKKGPHPVDDVKRIVRSCMPSGYATMIECGYSTMEMPSVGQALTSTTTSVDSTSLITKKGIEKVGASRESYSGENCSTPKDLKKHEVTCNMTANVVNSLSTNNTSLNLGGRPQGSTAVPSLASKLAFATRLNSKYAEMAETRSTDHYEASTPRSTFSEITKRRASAVPGLGNRDAMELLKAARQRLIYGLEEELTPRSARSNGKLLFRTDGKNGQNNGLPPTRPRAIYAPSLGSVSKTSREKDTDFSHYAELEKLENGSDAGSEQQPTDEAEEEWMDADIDDAASLTTIGSYAPKYAASVVSMKPIAKKSMQVYTGSMQGATNVLFGDCDEEDEEGGSDMGEEEDSNDVSLPVLANLLKTNDAGLAASLAENLAIKAQTDPSVLQDIPRMDIIPSLVKILGLPSDAAKSAAARALGVIGERNPDARLQILNCGALSKLSEMNKQVEASRLSVEEGSMEDVSEAVRFALSALNSTARAAPSVDVSPQMLVELLMSPDEEMQASATLELLEKLDSVYAEIVIKELADSSVCMSLVDLLEHSEEDIQLAAAEILSKMIFHDQKTQQDLSQSVGIVSKLLRLVKQSGPDRISVKAAATQVIRGLAHNNSKIREDVLKRGVIPEFASLLCCNDMHIRETAAWMLGMMASHSKNGREEVSSNDQAMFLLEEIAENGMAQEKIAAKFALRSIASQNIGGADEDELSSPLVIHSLQTGTKEVKIAAAWELCRMASSNQWSQVEIFECGGITALLTYLKARPGSDGIQACLATLVKLASSETRIAAQISQEGGVLMAVRLLKSPSTPDKKLVIQLLTLLAQKCPIHQQEVVSNGAVPVLVELLFSEENICTAACQALGCLVENDLSVISMAVAECALPTLLEIISNSECQSFSKKAAVQLVGKMGAATYECQQIVIQQGGIDVLAEVMQNGDDHDVMLGAAQAMNALSRKSFRDQGMDSIPRLVQVLESNATQRKTRTPGLVTMSEYVPSSPMSSGSTMSHSDTSTRSFNRRASISVPPQLAVVPESVKEDSEVEADDTYSVTIQESPESPMSRTTYEPTPKRMPMNFEACFNDAFSDDGLGSVVEETRSRVSVPSVIEETKSRASVSVYEETKSRCGLPPTPSAASVTRRPPSIKLPEEPRKPKPAPNKTAKELEHIVRNLRQSQNLREAQGQGRSRQISATINQIRGLMASDRHIGSHLLKTGAVGMLVDQLRPLR